MTLVLVILGALAIGLLAGAVLLIARRRGEAALERERAERAAAITREELAKITVELEVDTTPLELAFARLGLAFAYQSLAITRAARAFRAGLAGLPLEVDESLEPGTLELRDGDVVVGRIENVDKATS
jgi:hypothetical protein